MGVLLGHGEQPGEQRIGGDEAERGERQVPSVPPSSSLASKSSSLLSATHQQAAPTLGFLRNLVGDALSWSGSSGGVQPVVTLTF